jgi:[ribosomal protein S5]-alanine N-acetyltransferase
MRIIEAGPLVLEPQTAAHAAEMFRVLSDPAIYEFENEPPESLEWLRARFTKLETRSSADGSEQWLNWVIRLPGSELIGYVQATVHLDGGAGIAYELSSVHWGRGLAHRAVEAMISELVARYGVRSLFAVLKRANFRSMRLLERLGFSLASPEQQLAHRIEPDESLMCREISRATSANLPPGLVVLYRWRLVPGSEASFSEAWSRVTESLRHAGSLGSRLHRGSDGLWYGYAQWPSDETRQRAFAHQLDPAALAQMRTAIAESYPEVHLEPVADYLVQPVPTRP